MTITHSMAITVVHLAGLYQLFYHSYDMTMIDSSVQCAAKQTPVLVLHTARQQLFPQLLAEQGHTVLSNEQQVCASSRAMRKMSDSG